jgi:glutamyl-tRNA synthetase/glutamyl-Q tRNA(Asp) synthetase
VLLRIEDHDRIRSRRAFEAAILEDLAWLGFVPDAGLNPVRRQSDNDSAYATALATLAATHHVYACDCSRKEIRRRRLPHGEHASAEHVAALAGQVEDRYPGTCRQKRLRPGEALPSGIGVRVQLDDRPESFTDGALGEIVQTPSEQCGDLLLRDRDGNWTYQFTVTVDDMNDDVNLVVRGLDLLSSTGRQIKLARMLGRTEPSHFFHHPLIIKPDGEKLSKSSQDSGVRELRAAGVDAPAVLGLAAASVGLIDRGARVAPDAVSELVGDPRRGR